VKDMFHLLMLLDSYYAQTMVWTLDVGTPWDIKITSCLRSLDTTFSAQLASSQGLMSSHHHARKLM
jgi:hypothetical protein